MSDEFNVKSPDSGTTEFRSQLKKLDDKGASCKKIKLKLINKTSDVPEAISQLRRCSKLAFDCEGVRLGRNGKLSLLQVGEKDGVIYLFDVLELGRDLFEAGMKEILESKSIIKYMFDCRGDCDALYHEYGVKVTNIHDMQLFEFITRTVANKLLLKSYQAKHYHCDRVRGMNATIKMYVPATKMDRSHTELKDAGHCVMEADKTVWRYRPLNEGMKKYAALDIDMIWMVLEALERFQKLTGNTVERIKIASEVYAGTRRDAEPQPLEKYIRNPVMLSYVIPDVDCNGRVKPLPCGNTQCMGCRRCFENNFVNRNSLCKDCVEITRVNNYRGL